MLVEGDIEHRLHALAMLAPVPDDVLAEYAEPIAAAASGGSAQARAAAAPLAARVWAPVAEHLEALAVEAKPEQRGRALQLLWDAGDEVQRAKAMEIGRADRAASVRAVVDGFTAPPRPEEMPVPELPDPEPVDWAVGWTGELEELMAAYVAERRWRHAADVRSSSASLTPEAVLATLREQLGSGYEGLTCVFWAPERARSAELLLRSHYVLRQVELALA